eukprot:3744808-Prymnesium_polylepis.1
MAVESGSVSMLTMGSHQTTASMAWSISATTLDSARAPVPQLRQRGAPTPAPAPATGRWVVSPPCALCGCAQPAKSRGAPLAARST